MVIYRPHRELLADALLEAKEFETIEDMKHYIYEEQKKLYLELGFKSAPFEIDDIVIMDEAVDDSRCKWHDTRHVCAKRFGNENYMNKYGAPQCIGMCATDYEK